MKKIGIIHSFLEYPLIIADYDEHDIECEKKLIERLKEIAEVEIYHKFGALTVRHIKTNVEDTKKPFDYFIANIPYRYSGWDGDYLPEMYKAKRHAACDDLNLLLHMQEDFPDTKVILLAKSFEICEEARGYSYISHIIDTSNYPARNKNLDQIVGWVA
ncbi:MAG: hypothetical protein V3V78_04215 [Candidatus Woesearchaeota archaeon]